MNIKLLIAKGLKIILNPPALRNCKIDKTAVVHSGSELTNVTMGRYSGIANRCFLVNVNIGSFCSISDRCIIGGAPHAIDRVSSCNAFVAGKNDLRRNFASFSQPSTPKTVIENDVWLGMGVFVKAGVTIHSGAVVGMGSVVTKDVPAYEVWAGNPAKKIKDRFDDDTKKKLLATKWWEWSDERLQKEAKSFDDVEKLLSNVSII